MGSDDKKPKIKIMQVSNISVTASRDQIYTMLQYIGRIDDIKIYPSDANITSSTTQKVAFVKYDDERSVEVGQHLTNTVLIDRAVVCVPWLQPTIPDEATFMNSGGPTSAGQRQLPPHVSNKVQVDGDGVSMLLTVDPTLEQLGLPAYPALPGDTDPAKVEEIRRTVYIGNLPKGIDGQTVSDFFNSYIGEVMYVRMASGPDTLPCAYAYVEFSQQTTVPIALQNSGIEFQGRLLKIQHSRVAIIKPQQKTADQALEEVEEAIRLGKTGATADTGRSRTRSPRRRASSPRRRSRSRDRERSRRRSKSRDRKRSRSRERRRSRSRDKDARRRSRSRDRRSRRSRSRDRRERSKSRDRKRSRSRDRKRREKDRKRSRSRSRDRSDRKKDKRDRSSDRRRSTKDKKDDKENEKSAKEVADEEEKLRDKLLEKAAARNGTTDGSVSDVDMEQPKKEKTPSKIKNERKRRLSDSD